MLSRGKIKEEILMKQSLADLRPGQTGVVLTLNDGGRNLALRLHDLGLTAGTPVTCTLTAPLGDPAAYRFRGSLIALRRADASVVSVDAEPMPEAASLPRSAVSPEEASC